MTKWKIYNEDAVKWAKNYQKAKFHALLCDAPYHLTSITKRFGKKSSAPAKFGTDGVFSRASKGFMGTQWDGGDLAFRPETWEAFSEVLHPGAFGMAFSASRNWHRMAVAIEDAGFILHPTIFLWAYGQGFPKATNIAKQIQPASEMKIVGSRKKLESYGKGNSIYGGGPDHNGVLEYLEPTDEMAARWVGHRYGLQALKPAVEPIIVFQKPYEDKPLDNIVETGAGALNIEGGRISTQDDYVINQFEDGMKPFGNGAGHKYKTLRRNAKGGDNGLSGTSTFKIRERHAEDFPEPSGRWPANLILDGSAERLDAQTGNLGKSSGGKGIASQSATLSFAQDRVGGYKPILRANAGGLGDSGGASRFFYNVSTKLDESDPVYYCGKVSPKERNAGLEEKNGHPTLKPIDLMRYLATLLLPPIEYAPRRIFIPFAGVASEMCGAGLAGWEHIVGVENDTENGYVDIAEKRLQHWLGTR